MRRVWLNDLRPLQAEILAFFGPDLLGGAIELKGLRLHEEHKVSASAHPLVGWWNSFLRDIDRSLERNAISISQDSARLLELYTDLQEIKSLPNVDRILAQIRNRSTFYSAAFEAASAAMFHSRGYDIEITAEGKVKGKKTPDFVVHSGSSNVNIEAKSLEDLSIAETRLLRIMCVEILDSLIKNRRCVRARLDFSSRVSGSECARVVRSFDYLIQTGADALCWDVGGICRVEITPICQWGEWFPGRWCPPAEKEGRLGFYRVNAILTAEGEGFFRNPLIVSVRPHFEAHIQKRIMKQMRESSSKFSSDEAGVVHVLLPYSAGKTLMEVVDSSYADVFKKLNKDHGKINAVVLSAQLFGPQQSNSPIRYERYIIPNMRARAELPEGFKLPFSDEKFSNQLERKGGLRVKFSLSSLVEQQVGRSLLWKCSKDGRNQIMIWFTHHGKLRAEIVCPAHGRVVCESRADIELDDSSHSIEVAWSDQKMVLVLDGERIGMTNLGGKELHNKL